MTPMSFRMSSSSGSSLSFDKPPKQENGQGQRKNQRASFHKRLKPEILQVVTNIQVVRDLEKQEKLEQDTNSEVIFGNSDHREIYETFFPRLAYLNLDATLIQAHLDIFKMMRPLFLKWLETRERVNCDEKDFKAMHKRKCVQAPPLMTSQKFKAMSLSEQYESVFGPIDPSRKKLRELPYFIKIVSR